MARRIIKPILDLHDNYVKMNLLNPYILGYSTNSFVMEVNCSKITLPLRVGFTYNFDVDYGDGTLLHVSSYNDSNASHTYSSSGDYKIKITGTCESIYFNNGIEKLKLIRVIQWGNVGIKAIDGGFYGCSNLISIPDSPITGMEQVTSFYVTFAYCSSLTRSIPSGLFDYCPNVTNFYGTFYNCSSLTGSIPTGLFDNCPNVTNFQSTFYNCSSLTGSIPAGLFDNCPNVTNFQYTFYNCSSLTGSIPTGLFINNKKVTTYNRTFEYCRNLILDTSIFDLPSLSIVTDFTHCFYRQATSYSDTGTAPDIWNYATGATPTQCFTNETALSNYTSIPATWK